MDHIILAIAYGFFERIFSPFTSKFVQNDFLNLTNAQSSSIIYNGIKPIISKEDIDMIKSLHSSLVTRKKILFDLIEEDEELTKVKIADLIYSLCALL